jgi:predicted nucleic acid-binding protein
MPIDRVVVNSSPLIVLFSSGQEALLGQLWHEVLVPGAVWSEVLAGGPQDAAAQQLPTASWARQVEVPVIAPVIAAWDLGPGESEVLTFALTHPGYRAMVDDAGARRCARTLGIPILGTGGALILAKRRGLIASVAESLTALRNAGLWLSDELVTLLKQQAGEIQNGT